MEEKRIASHGREIQKRKISMTTAGPFTSLTRFCELCKCALRRQRSVPWVRVMSIFIFCAINKILIENSHYIMIKSFEPKCNFVTI